MATALAVFLSACTGLEPAVIGAGASAAETGVTFFSRGKARSFEAVRFADAVEAVHRAAEALGFDRVKDESLEGTNDERVRIVYQDLKHETVVVVVEKRTSWVTMLQSDVGLLGSTGLASVLLTRAQRELREMGAYAEYTVPENPPPKD